MTSWKVLTYVNRALTGIWTLLVIYSLLQPNGSTDAAGRGSESSIKVLMVFALLILIGLNLLPYHWSEVVALLLAILVLLLAYSITRE